MMVESSGEGFSDTGSTPVYSIAFGKIETAQKLHIAKTHAENAKEPPESGNVHNLEAVFVGISIERTTGPSNRTPAAHPSGGKQYKRLSAFGVWGTGKLNISYRDGQNPL